MIRRVVLALAVLAAAAAVCPAQLEWDKPSKHKPYANPSTVRVSRDDAAKTVRQVLEEQGFTIKSDGIEENRGIVIIVTEPMVFTKGIVADSQFKHFADVAGSTVRRVVRGRVTLKVEVAPINTTSATVGISAAFQGQSEGAVPSEWISGQSRGVFEDRLLCYVVTRANGDTRNCDTDEY